MDEWRAIVTKARKDPKFKAKLLKDPNAVLKAYGIKAFELGSHGGEEPVTISNATNLTAYAVRGEKKLFVTIINKSHCNNAQAAHVQIVAPGFGGHAENIFLLRKL